MITKAEAAHPAWYVQRLYKPLELLTLRHEKYLQTKETTDLKRLVSMFWSAGRTPVAQYNMFRIAHPEAYATQQEFRFVPTQVLKFTVT